MANGPRLTAAEGFRVQRALFELRKDERSDRALAKRVGVSSGTLCRLLRPGYPGSASYETAKRVARLVGVKVDALLSGAGGEKEASDG